MFPRKTSKAPDAKTGATTSETPQAQPPFDVRDVREKLGFDRDDENITVKFMPLGRHDDMGFDEIDAVIRDIEQVLGIGPRLTNGDEPVLARGPSPFTNDLGRRAGLTGLPDGDPNVTVDGNGQTLSAEDDRVLRMQANVSAVMEAEVYNEVMAAVRKHPPMHSPHEGWAVIQEECDELWDEVKADRGRMLSARKEAIQTAATAIRYLVDIDPR